MKREKKSTDQDLAEKALIKLLEFLESQPYEGSIWAAAMFTAIANNFCDSGVGYEEYKEEMKKMVDSYKYIWEE